MIIVINALSARRGGGQTYVKNLLANTHFLKEEHKIYLLAPSSLKLPDSSVITRIETRWPLNNPFMRSFWEKFIFPLLLKRLKADLLFCPGGVVNTKVPRGCKVATMFRNMTPFDKEQRKRFPYGYMRLRNWILEKVLLQSMCRADLVIFISEYAKRVIEKRASGKIKNSIVIPHGINELFKVNPIDALSRPNWLPEKEYLLYVSDLDYYKNQMEVINAFALLKKQRPTSEKLILVGHSHNAYAEKVKAEINRLGIEKDVLISGNKKYDDLPSVYFHAKLVIFASSCENCPNILLEAMGIGKPLLVSSVPPMPEFGKESVVYFDPRNPQNLCNKILEVIDKPQVLNQLAEKATNQSQQYNWQDTARKTWEILLSLAWKKEALSK